MQKNCKKSLSFFLALVLAVSFFALPKSAFALDYTETIEAFSYEGFEIPAYDGDFYEEINGNKPCFTQSELTQSIYESYSPLDSLGRVGECEANIDQSLMPAEPRGDISSVKPTGWIQKQYDFVSGKYLYNRSHLIGWQLTGENANKNNLMTGTRTFNASGMLPFENAVASYVKQNSQNNVLYRVTPVFQGDNLLASGVIMEAESVDDLGASVCFCVFVYNVEKGVSINYETGDNIQSGTTRSISGAYIRLTSLYPEYTGKEQKPLEYVELKGVRLKEGSDYTVKYTSNKNIGKAEVTVTGIGIYSGSAVKSFNIVKPSVPATDVKKLVKRVKGFTVKWDVKSGISGYQIQYSTNKSFKNAKIITVNKKAAKSKAVKRLKKKKVYYVRIRAYKTVNKKKFYSNWSKYKSVKTK